MITTIETEIDCPVCHEKIMAKHRNMNAGFVEYFCQNGEPKYHLGFSAWDVYSGFFRKEYEKFPISSNDNTHFSIYDSSSIFNQIVEVNNITYHKWWRAFDNFTRTFLSLENKTEKSVTIVSAFGYDPDFYSPTLEQDLIKKFNKIALMS